MSYFHKSVGTDVSSPQPHVTGDKDVSFLPVQGGHLSRGSGIQLGEAFYWNHTL